MTENILGIDLGTSSVKLIFGKDGKNAKAREGYSEISTRGWWDAICRAAKTMDLSEVRCIGLSSQVGTYIIDGGDVIGWNTGVGKEELDAILFDIPREVFIKEISMPHPSVISYPLPRLKYILDHYDGAKKICMPKDFICERLTGNYVSDKFSWRGLANLDICEYSEYLLKYIGAEKLDLPKLCEPTALAGYVTAEAAQETGIREGTPVYVGCNDFFAGTLGMGMVDVGDMFDITGTSEHLGIIEAEIAPYDGLVTGKYFFGNAHYGVTASSGKSLDFGGSIFPLRDVDLNTALANDPPVFLPYLCGERAPIWDADARGVFFGINAKTTPHDMAYAVLEGVAFSMYHIYECMGCPNAKVITVAGGAGKDPTLNLMKASLFGLPLRVCKESDTSALGAQIIAAVGFGFYPSVERAVRGICAYSDEITPDARLGEILRRRYEIYKNLYPTLKNSFKSLK